MTPVEEIRKAAALMRERAQAARTGPWTALDNGYVAGPVGSCNCAGGTPEANYMHEPYCGYEPLADTGQPANDAQGSLDAEHIASWHPQVALAVADWLEREAFRLAHDVMVGKVGDDHYVYECRPCGVLGSASKASVERWQTDHVQVQWEADPLALAVARAYLGGAS